MLLFLRILFILILAVMTWGTVRASLQQAMFDIPPEVTGNPWFQVTLFDAYFAFITFYVWIAWKERNLAARILWLIVVGGFVGVAVIGMPFTAACFAYSALLVGFGRTGTLIPATILLTLLFELALAERRCVELVDEGGDPIPPGGIPSDGA